MDRLNPSEVGLMTLDTTRHPAHVGAVHIFSGANQLDHDQLLDLVRDRLRFVPRYRQRVMSLPGGVLPPAWVDDTHFDLSFHVRRSAIPRPGQDQQLQEFLGRIMSRRLDRGRPLWELYVVEGLAQDRWALVAKTHLALVDGEDTVDLVQLLLDSDPDAPIEEPAPWIPSPEPTPLDLLVSSTYAAVSDPKELLTQTQRGVSAAVSNLSALASPRPTGWSHLGDLASAALMGTAPSTSSPFVGLTSAQRRYATVTADLEDLRAVRDRLGHTINDVVLAVIAGGLRGWLQHRGARLDNVQALVPMSVTDADGPSSLGCRVTPHLAALPVGEASAVMRVHQIAISTQAHKDAGHAVAARTLSEIAGFAPATLQLMGVRAAYQSSRRRYDVVVTNVPGPYETVYAASRALESSQPVVPLASGHLLGIGVTSYRSAVCLGITGDRDAVADMDILQACLAEAVDELVAAARKEPR